MEIWKDVPNHVGEYMVSNAGRVKSLARIIKASNRDIRRSERIIKCHVNNSGYKLVCLYGSIRKTILLHRLVGSVFVGGHFEGAQINHINEDKLDNRSSNLEWVTPFENINKWHKNNPQKHSNSRKRSVIQYSMDMVEIARYDSVKEARRVTGCSLISQVCLGYYESSKGFIWRHDNDC
jgi:hypothetical protein